MADRDGNGTAELIVLLTTITDPAHARADELAAAYHQRGEEETGNDQLKTHLRGPGRVLRSRLPDLVHQEIWAWLLVHHAISVLITQAAQATDIDPDRTSFTRALRIVRRTATGIWRASQIPDTGPNKVRTGMKGAKCQRRRKYTPEFKDEAAKLVIETSRPIAEIAQDNRRERGHAGELGNEIPERPPRRGRCQVVG